MLTCICPNAGTVTSCRVPLMFVYGQRSRLLSRCHPVNWHVCICINGKLTIDNLALQLQLLLVFAFALYRRKCSITKQLGNQALTALT